MMALASLALPRMPTEHKRRHAAAAADAASPRCELGALFSELGSDKYRTHHYERAYCALLAPQRQSVRTLVELGTARGAGSASFAAYLPNAEVFGVARELEGDLIRNGTLGASPWTKLGTSEPLLL